MSQGNCLEDGWIQKDELPCFPYIKSQLFMNCVHSTVSKGFPDGSDSKEFACNSGVVGLIQGSGRSPGGGNGYPLQYSCLENSMERSLAGYSAWGCKESDTTETLLCFYCFKSIIQTIFAHFNYITFSFL